MLNTAQQSRNQNNHRGTARPSGRNQRPNPQMARITPFKASDIAGPFVAPLPRIGSYTYDPGTPNQKRPDRIQNAALLAHGLPIMTLMWRTWEKPRSRPSVSGSKNVAPLISAQLRRFGEAHRCTREYISSRRLVSIQKACQKNKNLRSCSTETQRK